MGAQFLKRKKLHININVRIFIEASGCCICFIKSDSSSLNLIFFSESNFVDIYSNHGSSLLISVLVLQKLTKISITCSFSLVLSPLDYKLHEVRECICYLHKAYSGDSVDIG